MLSVDTGRRGEIAATVYGERAYIGLREVNGEPRMYFRRPGANAVCWFPGPPIDPISLAWVRSLCYVSIPADQSSVALGAILEAGVTCPMPQADVYEW